MTQGEKELESRIELLDRLYDRFKLGIKKLGGYNGYVYSIPLSEILIHAVHELEGHNRQQDGDNIISNTLNNPDNES